MMCSVTMKKDTYDEKSALCQACKYNADCAEDSAWQKYKADIDKTDIGKAIKQLVKFIVDNDIHCKISQTYAYEVYQELPASRLSERDFILCVLDEVDEYPWIIH